ncbi:MAG: ABC transporter ATP-binding protein, partial [Actinobacteria bacterium]|nr:ABC transporter ATP-binding protein [Actinomycetota bacterium]
MKQEVSDSRSSFVVWRLLKSSERRALVGIIFLIIVGLILETLSLGIVMPVVAILTQDDYQTKYRWLTDNLGSPSREDLIVIVMLLMVGIYIVRSLFLLWSSWVQKGFSAALSGRLSQRLFTIYLRQPYLFHLQHNSATLMRNSRNANVVVTGGIDPTLVLLTDGLVAIALFTLLIIVEPVGTIITLVAFGVGAWLFQLLTRRRIERWGDQRNLHDGMILQHLQQGLGGAKDVKILGRESEFLDQHEKHLKESLRINRVYSVLQTMPRMYMEILTIAGLAALVISMVLQKQSFTEIIPTLGLFAAAAFRVMPSINRLLGALQTLIYSRAIIASVYADFKLDAPDENKLVTGIPFSEQLELRSVTFQYPTASTPSLQQVSLVVRRG